MISYEGREVGTSPKPSGGNSPRQHLALGTCLQKYEILILD